MKINPQSGLVRTVIIVIVAILILSYFGINLRSIVESPVAKENFSYVMTGITFVWQNYLSKPLTYFWNNIFIDLIWKAFVSTFERLRDDGETPFSGMSPTVQTD